MVTVIRNHEGRNIICNVSETMLSGELTRSANFFKLKRGRDGEEELIDCPPSLDAVKDLLALPPSVWEFLALQGITEAPCLRPDGTIIQEAGYDSATRLLYIPAEHLQSLTIPEHPEGDDMRRALETIEDVISGFPFVDEASKANALAMLLTPINRPAIDGSVPMVLIDATTQGTGKTLLCAIVSIIASGREPNLYSAPKDSEEFRRLLSGILSEAASLVTFDNVSTKLDSPELCRAITTPFWGDRILKLNQTFELPVRCTWIANGNNLQLGGDMPRRCYWVRMDAQCARPFQRTGFKHPDLKTFVWEHRPELLVSLLIMSRAWFAAGCPRPQIPLLGGFEEWTFTIGEILGRQE